MAKLTISKLDAAKRQLETAIALYFQEADPVSIHALANAAHELLDDLSVHRTAEPMLIRAMGENIRPEFTKEFIQRLNRARNFFKHANRDPEAFLEFDPSETDAWLLDATVTYTRLSSEQTPVMNTYIIWSALTWAKGGIVYSMDPAEFEATAQRAAAMTKRNFFSDALPQAYGTVYGPVK